jgi:hypothetical protein
VRRRGRPAGLLVSEFCSRLVDLVVCVCGHGCGRHRLTLAGKRFIRLVAEDIAGVIDRGGDFRDPRSGNGTQRVTGDGCGRFVVPEPVEERGEDS